MSALLHGNSRLVDREELDRIVTPAATSTYQPVPHGELVDLVERSLASTPFRVRDRRFAIAHEGRRLFGLLTLDHEGGAWDHATTIGIANGHDKKIKAKFAIGSQVFVCDNLAFLGDEAVETRHSSRVKERLPLLVDDAISRLLSQHEKQEHRISIYKSSEVRGQAHLHDLVLRAYRCEAIPSKAVPLVLDEYDAGRHPEFSERTLWSLFNAFTETLKGFSSLPSRTQRLHKLFDAECNLAV